MIKKFLSLIVLLSFTFAVQVTFNVDMSNDGAIAGSNTISLQADFAGWWPGIVMNDDDGDLVFSTTVDLEPGYYEYKFAGYEWSDTEFADWSMTEAEAGPCIALENCSGENGECQFINRFINVGAEDEVLDPVCWASCDACVALPGGALTNASFEDDLNGWGGEHNGSYVVDMTGALVHTSDDIFEALDGEYGLKTWGRYDGSPLNVFSQSFALDAGNELSFSGFVFSHPDDQIGGDNSAYLSLNWSNDAGDLGQDLSEMFTALSVPDVWTELSVTGVAPEGATNVEVAINYNQLANADGSVYWDFMNLNATGTLYISGCTDPEAMNYNPDANIDDGSCYYDGDFVNVTFNVDFSCEGEGVDPFLAGGDTFGNPGDNPMTDPDSDGIYSITVQMLPNTGTDYTFTNGACGDWSCKESIAGQDCATEPWSDRHIDVGEEDMVVNTCFAQCVDGTCGECPDPNVGECLEEQVAVTFYVDLSLNPEVAEANTVALMGEFNGWWPGDVMEDLGDYVYTTTLCLGAETDYEYKFAGYEWSISEFPDALYPVGEPPCPGTTSTVECQYGTCTNRLLTTAAEDQALDVVYWAGCDTYEYIATPLVTFGVDLSLNPEIAANNTIALQSDFGGWWPGIIMNDDDGDLYYEVTVPLEAGYYEYKFAGYEWSTTEFEDWSLTEENAPECLVLAGCTGENGECQFINRSVEVTEAVELDGVYWSTCDIVETVPEVTFQVDLSQNPDLAANHTIALQGSFAGWWPGIPMDDSDGDMVYTVTLELEPGNYEYKFAGYEWSTTEFPDWSMTEAEAPECLILAECTGENGECNFINRYVDVVDDVVLDEVCWATCEECPDVEPNYVDVTFQVDMIGVDTSEGVYLAGGTIGSEDPGVASMGWLMSDDDGDEIFTKTLSLLAGTHQNFKYRTQPSYGWEGNWEEVPEACGEGQYLDRWVDVAETDMMLDVVCWASCEACMTCGDGDMTGEGNVDVLDVVAIVAVILGTSELEVDYATCHGDVDESGAVDVLDLVMIIDWILSTRPDGEEAYKAVLINSENGVDIVANGYIGGVQMVLSHDADFTISMPDDAYLAEYNTTVNQTTVVILRPGKELFTSTGEFEVVEVLAASGNHYVDVTTVTDYHLLSNYPNPFNASTTIEYVMPVDGMVKLEIYDVLGRNVNTLINGYTEAGVYSVLWNGTDNLGATLSSGLYFVQIEYAGGISNQKIMLLK